MNDPNKKRLDADLGNTETIYVSVSMTEEEFDKFHHYCQQTDKTHNQAFCDGIKSLSVKK